MGVCVIERLFCPAFETPTRRAYVCGDFVGNYLYVRNSYQPVETVIHAAAAVLAEVECAAVASAVVYSPLVAAAVGDIHGFLCGCIGRGCCFWIVVI
jgi:hypothetical protein